MQDGNNKESRLEHIRLQIDLLKMKLTNIDDILACQEKAINLITEKSKLLFAESRLSEDSPEEIIKSIFKDRKIPDILRKSGK